MKFFASLIAKLTGGAESPKTLDQARSTFAEAKSALDRIAAMFSAAGLDFDALLAKGDLALKDYVAELNQKAVAAEQVATAAQAKLAEETAKRESVSAEKEALATTVAGHISIFSSIGFKPADVKGKDGAAATAEEIATVFQAAFKSHVSSAVTQQLQEIGQPAAKLPTPSNVGGSFSSTADELRAQYDLLVASGKHVEAGQFFQKYSATMYPAAGRN